MVRSLSYTAFFARVCGLFCASYLYCINTLDASAALAISGVTTVLCSILGPVLGELRVDGIEPQGEEPLRPRDRPHVGHRAGDQPGVEVVEQRRDEFR